MLGVLEVSERHVNSADARGRVQRGGEDRLRRRGRRAYVEYLDGDLYAYEGVPAGVFEQLTKADSKGTFVNAVIKQYPFRSI